MYLALLLAEWYLRGQLAARGLGLVRVTLVAENAENSLLGTVLWSR
jgi:hypothetical protein